METSQTYEPFDRFQKKFSSTDQNVSWFRKMENVSALDSHIPGIWYSGFLYARNTGHKYYMVHKDRDDVALKRRQQLKQCKWYGINLNWMQLETQINWLHWGGSCLRRGVGGGRISWGPSRRPTDQFQARFTFALQRFPKHLSFLTFTFSRRFFSSLIWSWFQETRLIFTFRHNLRESWILLLHHQVLVLAILLVKALHLHHIHFRVKSNMILRDQVDHKYHSSHSWS